MDSVERVLTEPAMAHHEWEHLVVVVVVACCYGDYSMAGLTMTPSTTLMRLLDIRRTVRCDSNHFSPQLVRQIRRQVWLVTPGINLVRLLFVSLVR
jgi:hypothetical protein